MDVDYQRIWAEAADFAAFTTGLTAAWSQAYRKVVKKADDLVMIDPGNGFN